MSRDSMFEPVKCNGCVLCCKNDTITLLTTEFSKYNSEPHHMVKGGRMLAHKPNGDCFYLGEKGCMIQSNKPSRCREMDCRWLAKKLSAQQAQRLADENKFQMAIWWRGKELLKADE